MKKIKIFRLNSDVKSNEELINNWVEQNNVNIISTNIIPAQPNHAYSMIIIIYTINNELKLNS